MNEKFPEQTITIAIFNVILRKKCPRPITENDD